MEGCLLEQLHWDKEKGEGMLNSSAYRHTVYAEYGGQRVLLPSPGNPVAVGTRCDSNLILQYHQMNLIRYQIGCDLMADQKFQMTCRRKTLGTHL